MSGVEERLVLRHDALRRESTIVLLLIRLLLFTLIFLLEEGFV